MPTKTTESFLFSPGKLVETATAIYSTDPHYRLAEGTVGIIIQGPRPGYREQCQVHFVSLDEPWWVHFNEIKPYIN